ncbi:MAG: antibiotic biosynthesis monooxygenase [Planctomycetaceae bacterium]
MQNTSPLASIHSESHFAVIFTSRRQLDDGIDYSIAARRMFELATLQDGFLGIDSVRDADLKGITVSYWRDLDAIRAWYAVSEHRNVQELGRRLWYTAYTVRICEVQRSYHFRRDDPESKPGGE